MMVRTEKYGGLDRDSNEAAGKVCERILPDPEIRRQTLTAFAEMIELCDTQGAAKWGITLYPSQLCLNVCGFYSCWAKPGEFNVAVMTDAISPENWATLDAQIHRRGAFKRISGSEFLHISLEQVPETLPLVSEAMRQFVLVTASKYDSMGGRVEGAHSPGVLAYLNDALGLQLPEPSYRQQTGTRAVWKIAPGANAYLWEECLAKSAIGIGWLQNADYTEFADKRAIQDALTAAGDRERGAASILRFVKEIEPENIVVANKGNNGVVGIGIITSDYLPPDAPDNPDISYKHARRVDWRVTQPVTMPRAFFGQVPETVLRLNASKWQQIRQAYLDAYPNDAALQAALDRLSDTPTINPPTMPINAPTIPESVRPILEMTNRTKNILLYGPPGTGKTWTVNQFAKAFTDADKTRFVTFHQSFAYEEFIEGIRPVLVEGQVKYDVRDGIFKSICRVAQADPDAPYLLVIDEINRANIAKVLGELITLIEDDKRTDKDGRNENALRVTLPYSGETFGVPSNLTILGTMNTADRSIALLDLALRRRFTFVEMPPQSSLLSNDVAGVDLEKLLTTLNARITALLDKDHQIGHSYLMNLTDADGLRFAWYNRLVPLLQEYFYHDGERLQAVLGKTFVQEIKLDDATRKALGDAYDDAPKFEVNTKLDDAAFLTALQELAAQTQTGGNP